jgi:hypothetical protein
MACVTTCYWCRKSTCTASNRFSDGSILIGTVAMWYRFCHCDLLHVRWLFDSDGFWLWKRLKHIIGLQLIKYWHMFVRVYGFWLWSKTYNKPALHEVFQKRTWSDFCMLDHDFSWLVIVASLRPKIYQETRCMCFLASMWCANVKNSILWVYVFLNRCQLISNWHF